MNLLLYILSDILNDILRILPAIIFLALIIGILALGEWLYHLSYLAL